MPSDEELRERLAALQGRADRLEMKRTIRDQAPTVKYVNAVDALNRERLAAAEREATALDREDLARYVAKVKRDLAAERARIDRARRTESLNDFTSAADASTAAQAGEFR
jgi:hypothetical protein